MFKYLIRNFGQTILGLCILSSAVLVEGGMSSMDTKLDKAMGATYAVAAYQTQISASQLDEARPLNPSKPIKANRGEFGIPLPQHKPQQIAAR